MVVKTQVCNFSEHKIYPGKGVLVITKESKIMTFLHKKARAHYTRKVRPQKIRWSTAWRRLNKKIQTGNEKRKSRKKAKKVVREIVGLELESIVQKQGETKQERARLRDQAIKEIKDRKKAVAANKKKVATKK
jgi:large subunit ribosomal protein L24e